MPYLASGVNGKNEVFQMLKPPAVALSQAVFAIGTAHKDVALIQTCLESLYTTLSAVISHGGHFDSKLADYVFFPVSQVLKQSQRVSIRCMELSLAIIAILIQRGWSSNIQEQLARQIFILCTLLVGDSPSIASSDHTTPEIQRSAADCLAELFTALGASTRGTALLISDAHIPQLGQTISTLLQAVYQNTSPEVQESAIKALGILFGLALPSQILFNFLPGVVSTLTRLLTVKSDQRRRPEILISSLQILSSLFKCNFSDSIALLATTKAVAVDQQFEERVNGNHELQIDGSALEAAAPQIRLALGTIVRLRSHDRNDVITALGRLCMTILRHCRKVLQNCVQLAVETVLTLSTTANIPELHFEVTMLMSADSAILAVVQSTIFDWSQSLVRVMQAADDHAKKQRLQQIGTAYRCLADAGIDLTTTHQLLTQTLKDCVVLALQQTGSHEVQDQGLKALTSLSIPEKSVQIFSTITTSPSQSSIMQSIQDLVNVISANETSNGIIDTITQSITTSRETNLAANLWLVLQYLRTSLKRIDDLDLVVSVDASKAMLDEQLEAIYSFALSYLGTPSEEQNPVVTSLVLQILALRASSVGKEFRIELIDALYLVLHALATPQETIQHDSIVTLNVFTQACGYTSVQDLIVDNVDYLTNAVSLKLNAFDISPQAPQVLLMMVQLAGPRLVPYLEDIVESIFAALEDFHGYPLLVELLFKTLAVVAEEGSKAPLLDTRHDRPLLTAHGGVETSPPTSVADLAQTLAERAAVVLDQQSRSAHEAAPHEPWTKATEDSSTQEIQPPDNEEQPPPAPKTYSILVKITESTQHFLPSASPALRMSLLGLIRTTVPAIARHENTFLPLINTLWPEIVSRLDDDELSIRTSALEIITVLCEYAKDFMRSRIVELWPHLRDIWREMVREATASVSSSNQSTTLVSSTVLLRLSDKAKSDIQKMQMGPTDYSNASIRKIWQAFIQMLIAIVRSVPLSPEMFDEALQMAVPELTDPGVLATFTHENADAVWLAQWKAGNETIDWTPANPQAFVRVG